MLGTTPDSSQVKNRQSHAASDADDLASHGYRQHLNRSLGSFSSFAAGFSYISVLTGVFQLFGFGFGFGGPLLFWSWLIVLAGQFAVALVFAELGARVPLAGSVYQWAKRAGGRAASWMAGWLMLVGSIITIAAVAIAMQIVLPSIWPGFQVFKNDTHNAVFLGVCVIALTTIVNVLGVKVMSKINNVGVAAELLGLIVVIVALLFHLHRGPGIVLDVKGVGPGLPGWHTFGYLAPLMLAAIVPGYTLFGFDTAGSLAEETTEPRRRTPAAILRAVGAAGIAGAILLIVSMMAAKSAGVATLSTGGLPLVLQDALGSTVARILLCDVAIAIFVCALAIHTASIRIVFSMARDGNLPAAARLAHVTERSKSPTYPALVSGLIAILILLLNAGNSKLFLVVTSVGIVIVYIAYLLVTVPLLRLRARGWGYDDEAARQGLFTMGRYRGMAVNIVAVAWGVLMGVNLIWPRSDIYGAGAYAWGGVIVVGVVAAAGLIYYFGFQHRAANIVVEAHRNAAPLTLKEAGRAPVKRIVLVGLGATGVAIGRWLHGRAGCEIAGAADINPATVNTDLGGVLGVGTLDIAIVDDIGMLPPADLAIVATTSDLRQVSETLVPLLERRFNVLSICEELAYPWTSHPEVAARLDRTAKSNGVTVLGTGANPGVLMDTLPLLVSVLMQRVERVVIRRRTNMSRYGAILSKFGLGLTPEQFHAAQRAGQVIGHVGFEQAISALASGLGWELDSIEVDEVAPSVISETRRVGAHLTVDPGTISAVTHAARGVLNSVAVIDLEITFGFFDADDELGPGDDYRIEGEDQNLELSSASGFESFLSTIAAAVNVAHAVVDAPAGLLSMSDLPVRALASKGASFAVDGAS